MPKIETKIALESWIVFDIYLNSIYNILPGFRFLVFETDIFAKTTF